MRPNNVSSTAFHSLPYPALPTHMNSTAGPKSNTPIHQITKALALALGIPSTTLATTITSDETTHLETNTNTDLNTTLNSVALTTTTVTLNAYEFPFCLASDSDYLQNFFISRPTHTNLTLTLPPSFSAPNGECVPINASKGIPHSFYYTVYNDDDSKDGGKESRDFGPCELVTFEEEGCGGKATPYSLKVEGEGEPGQSDCFSKPDRFVKALLRSAMIKCEW